MCGLRGVVPGDGNQLGPMKKIRKLAKRAGLDVRKVEGRFRLWNPRSWSHLDVKGKKRVKKLLRRLLKKR